ncbi:hypothetical protein Y032_0273g967 [Ancylostoma ceylanicum]|uniref:Uncharacterized protein n=4 Tax=Ancylostoma ceylanicum TaxID=53326 RepID=A0A016S7X9_9BILA|nr:hypothetical protein Y032_0273g967 [Ancylostoma ceylanicum]
MLAMVGLAVAGLGNWVPMPSVPMPLVGSTQEQLGISLNTSTDRLLNVFTGGTNLTDIFSGFFPHRNATIPPVLNATLTTDGTSALNYTVEQILLRSNVTVSTDVMEIVAREQRDAYKKHVVSKLYGLSKKKGVFLNEIASTYNFNNEDKDKVCV